VSVKPYNNSACYGIKNYINDLIYESKQQAVTRRLNIAD
jgi:hypothetical protein